MRARFVNEVRRGGLPLGTIGAGAEMIYAGYFAMLREYPDIESYAVPLDGFVASLDAGGGNTWLPDLESPAGVGLSRVARAAMERVTGIPISEMMCVDVLALPDVEFPYHRRGSTDTASRVGLLLDWLAEGEEGPQLHELDEEEVARLAGGRGRGLTWHLAWWDWARIGYLSLADDSWMYLVYDRPAIVR